MINSFPIKQRVHKIPTKIDWLFLFFNTKFKNNPLSLRFNLVLMPLSIATTANFVPSTTQANNTTNAEIP